MIVPLTLMIFTWSLRLTYSRGLNKPATRIVGGVRCTVEENPFVVSLRTTHKLTHFCGGSLIKPQWVLTAAHCTVDFVLDPKELSCMVGLSLYQRSKMQAIAANKIYVHEFYHPSAIFHDISLVHLEREAILFDTVQLIKIPRVARKRTICRRGMLSGWGSLRAWDPDQELKPRAQISRYLMCAEVSIMSTDECIAYTRGRVDENVLCTLIGNDSKDACQGDSGGALFCGDIQVGIIASGKGCGVTNNLAYYTNLDQYIGFIDKIISKCRNVNVEVPMIIICNVIAISYYKIEF